MFDQRQLEVQFSAQALIKAEPFNDFPTRDIVLSQRFARRNYA